MPVPRILLLHGAATTAAVWAPVMDRLADLDLVALERPTTGDLAAELAAIEPHARGALVVGVSGGATLGLALAATAIPLAGAILHEPAVGSLAPGLLAPLATAFATGGVEGFGSALYGPSWNRAMAADDDGVVARELPMFRAFEPVRAADGQGPVLVTVGADSPVGRHEAASALRDRLGYPIEILAGCRHFVQWDQPDVFASLIRRTYATLA